MAEKNKNALQQYTIYLETWRKPTIQTQNVVLYTTLTKFNTPIKPTRSIKMCSNIAYTKVCGGRHLSHAFYTQKCLKQNDLPP
jgi:hypothetical protein